VLDLLYSSSNLSQTMISSSDILARIKSRAIELWGDKWIANISKEYANLAAAAGDTKANPVSRRRQLERAFTEGSCTLNTAILLAAAVGCRFQMSCTETRTIEF
jgi:hypothetical protein